MSTAIDLQNVKLEIVPIKPNLNAPYEIHKRMREEILAAFRVPPWAFTQSGNRYGLSIPYTHRVLEWEPHPFLRDEDYEGDE